MNFLVMKSEGALLRIVVQPNATKTRFVGEYDSRLKIALQAPPVDGAANEALLEFVAKALGISKKTVALVNGMKGRKKTILISDTSEEKIRACLTEAMK
jgi:uncharacterized protein (TIGR00251 family)